MMTDSSQANPGEVANHVSLSATDPENPEMA